MPSITSQKNIPVFNDYIPVSQYQNITILEAESFFASYSKAASDTVTLELYFRTSGTRFLSHIMFIAKSLLASTWQLYEGTSKTYNASNALTIYNRFRASANTPHDDVLCCHTPGGSGDGTQIAKGYCSGNSGPQTHGIYSELSELVLKPKTAYLFRITSNADNNNLDAEVNFHEEFDYDANMTTTTTTTSTTSTTSTSSSTTTTSSSTTTTTA